MIGKTVLHYKITEKLGEGGMGVVYKAHDTKLKRDVAIKFLPRQIAASDEERERFKIEAQAAASLNHPNIATIYAIEEVDGEMFIVMEYIEGEELREIIQIPLGPPLEKGEENQSPPFVKGGQGGFLPLDNILDYSSQIAAGLQAAHEKGVTHRDIKSSNIMITDEGQVKIMDFGLAKVSGGAHLTISGTTLGTVVYMSPEQTHGMGVDHRTDIWSLGVVLYEMLTGELPFKGGCEAGAIYSIMHDEPQPVSELRKEIPAKLNRVVEKALRKEPEARYQNMDELIADLRITMRTLSQHLSVAQRKPESFASFREKKTKKALPPAWLLAIVVGVGVAITGFLTFFGKSGSDSDLPPMRTVRLTSFPGQEYDPALSFDGNSVAFSWNGPDQDNFDIYVKLVDAGSPLRLTTDPVGDFRPAWSPDGRYIAFIRPTLNQ